MTKAPIYETHAMFNEIGGIISGSEDKNVDIIFLEKNFEEIL